MNLEERKLKKRIISLLLCLCMVFSLLPTAVLAADGEDTDTSVSSGSVMQQNPKNPDDQSDPDNQADPDDLNDSEDSDDSDAPQLLGEGLGSALHGNCGATDEDSVNWALSQNSDGSTYTLTISGDGAMADYTDPTKPDAEGVNIAPWYNSYSEYSETITKVQIDEGVTSIGDNAFKDLTSLEIANIPASITDLGDHIFRGDTNLTTVEWADGFKAPSIKDTDSKDDTYKGTYVPTSMFDGCSSLGKDVELSDWLPSSFTGVGCAAFRGTQFTVNFDAWRNLEYIGAYAFSEMPNLGSFRLTDKIIIGLRGDASNAFTKSGLKSLTVDVETVPKYFAYGANKLAEIVLTDRVENVGKGAFSCTAITELVIPSRVKKLGDWSFLNCSSLNKLTLLGEVTLEGVQFPGTPLEELVIGKDAVVTCTDDPFRATGDYPAMTSLEKASILGTFTSSSADRDAKTFWRCFSRSTNLTEVVLSGENAINFSQSAFPNVTTLSILGGDATFLGYTLGDSKLKQVTIDVGSYSSESGSFRYAKNLKTFRLKADSANLDNRAFVECPSLVAVDLTECSSITYGDNTFGSMTTTGQNNAPMSSTAIIYVSSTTADPKGADNKAGLSDSHGIVAITNGGTFAEDTEFTPGTLATPTKKDYTFGGWYTKDGTNGDWGNKVTDPTAGQTYYAKWEKNNTPDPTDADFTNGLVTVKCLSPVAHNDIQYGLNAAVASQKYATEQVSATEYSVTYDADAFAVNGHSLYSADKLNWKLTYDGNKWNLAPKTPGVDDVVLVTHAPTTFDEVTKFIDGRTDVIKTSCVNGRTGTCAYGLMVAFVNPEHVVSVEQEKDSNGQPIRGSYIATLKIDQFAKTCADACNKNFADSPRAHDVLSKDTVQWRFIVTRAEVTTDAGAEKPYVWSAEPVTPGTDDVCTIAHNWVVTFDPDNGEPAFTRNVKYDGNATEPTSDPEKTGYTFDGWYVDEAEEPFKFDTTTITADITLTAKWTQNTYTVTFDSNGGEGTMAGQNFTYDVEQALTANAFTRTGYTFTGWKDDGGNTYTDKQTVKNLTAENGATVTLYAVWTAKEVINKFDDTNATQSYTYDGSAKSYELTSEPGDFTITYKQGETEVSNPTNVGSYDVVISRAEDKTYAAFEQTISGGLVIIAADYPVTVSADKTAVTGGGTVKLTASSSAEGITVTGITCSDESISVVKNSDGTYSATLPNTTKTYTFTAEVSGVSANYGSGPATCTVSVTRRHTSSVTPGNTVSVPSTPNGTVTVNPSTASKGETVTITTKPNEGYELGSIEVLDKNGDSLKLKELGNGKYSFVMPNGKVSVEAEFVKTAATSFADVPANAYFADAVKWAVDKGITNGLTDTMFGPYESCTRAQIVTFLWRAAGSPEPKTASSFTDVPANAYYAKAVAWAVENGITNGMSATEFAPDATCTRGQSVTFLYRALKGTASSSVNFTDVPANAFYADAINWAVANNVTNGTSNTTFSPNADCTRAEIVTFLYRAYQGK